MTTLTTEPLAPLLDRLFKEADAASSPAMAALSRDERERLMRSKTDYLDLYGWMKDLWLPVSRETGTLLMCWPAAAAQNRSWNSAHRSASRRSTLPPRCGQWRWEIDHQRVRALQDRAGAPKPG